MIYFSGIDIGTTAVKAAAFSPEGKLLTVSAISYPTNYPKTGWAEQSAEEIWRAVKKAISQMLANTPGTLFAASFSSAMHGLMGVGHNGKALTPVLIWSDLRSAQQASKIKKSRHSENIYRSSGAPIHPMLPLCKLIWYREEQPDVFRQVKRWVSIKEYIIFKLTGHWVLDYSMAAATGLYDQYHHNWNTAALEITGVTLSQLSQLVSPDFLLPKVLPDIQKQTGLPIDVRLFAGSSDGCLANVGSGAIFQQCAAMTVGTSAAFRVSTPHPVHDPEGLLFCYPLLDNCLIIGGASNNAGNVWQWITHILHGKTLASGSIRKYLDQASQAPPGADGLWFLPYLAGERAPLSLGKAQGAFWGLSLRHDRQHLLRAVLEGMLFNLHLIGEKVQGLTGLRYQSIRLSGGLAKSSFFAQLAADIFGLKVELTQTEELSAFGAALLAMRASGLFDNLQGSSDKIVVSNQYEPDYNNTLIYRDYFADFQKIINNHLK